MRNNYTITIYKTKPNTNTLYYFLIQFIMNDSNSHWIIRTDDCDYSTRQFENIGKDEDLCLKDISECVEQKVGLNNYSTIELDATDVKWSRNWYDTIRELGNQFPDFKFKVRVIEEVIF